MTGDYAVGGLVGEDGYTLDGVQQAGTLDCKPVRIVGRNYGLIIRISSVNQPTRKCEITELEECVVVRERNHAAKRHSLIICPNMLQGGSQTKEYNYGD